MASTQDGGVSGGEDSTSQASEEQLVTLQIYVPELVVQKCMQFNREEIIWDVKNLILAALPKELKEGFNYGLFCPPVNGRAGRFLDEERPLMDYPFTENNAYVELRYKRRIYKAIMEEKQLKQLHSRTNLKRLLEHVHNSHVEKITKMCSRGLDPNFHCQETGDSPLTLATSLKHPAKVIMALVNGGAHLDFRTKDGCSVLHKAVEKNNHEALRTLLDLGSSPNYKDSRGLTTLYYSVLYNSDPKLTEMLLHDRALIGTADPHGWQEVHQACKYGLVRHLEHLSFFGADMNARNASGNTPLHVCAVNDQESCARVLLFRGADKNAHNYANQNPHQVAVIAGNLRLAEIIKNHKPEDVVPYREAPKYNPRRRTSTANTGGLSHNHSDPRLEDKQPPSPCPSNHSLPHTSTSSDGGHNHATHNHVEHDGATDALESTAINSSGTDSDPFDSAKSTPLMESVCVCIEEYNPSTSGHLQLAKGDLVDVLSVSGSGYLEGRRRDGEEGLFPAACVQETAVKCYQDSLPPGRYRTEGRRSTGGGKGEMPRKWRMFGEPRTVILHKGKKGFGFILRGAKATSPLMERQPTEFWPSLQYLDDVDKGGVAEMAGLKKGDFLLEINGQDVSQASHEHVVSIIRQSGDLVSMTVVTVVHQTSTLAPVDKNQLMDRQCATLPRKLSAKKAPLPPKRDPKTALSVGRARARSMVAGLAEMEVLDHTLNEYDSEDHSTKSSSVESISNRPTPEGGSASNAVSTKSRSRQVSVSEIEDFFARHLNSVDHHSHCGPVRNKHATMARIHKCKRGKKTTSFGHIIKEDTDFRIPKNYSSSPELDLLPEAEAQFIDVHRLRRSRSSGDVHFGHSRHCARRGYAKVAKDHHKKDKLLHRQHSIPEASKSHGDKQKVRERSSTPELQGPTIIKQHGSDIYAETVPVQAKGSDKARASCPPPSYPPPPPPLGQIIKVDVSRGEYADATLGRHQKSQAIMSSFRPTDNAKLYASPDAVTTVGYKIEQPQSCDVTLPRHLSKGNSARSHSLPPKITQNAKTEGRSTGSLDTDYSSGESTTGYEPSFKAAHKSREATGNEIPVADKKGTLRKAKNSGANKHPLGVSGSPKNHDFIPEPDDESDGDAASTIENKSDMVTFRAVENEKPKSSEPRPKADAKKRKESTKTSDMLLSEETGERIFVKSGKAEGDKQKSQKVPPMPPPKKNDSKQDLLEDQNESGDGKKAESKGQKECAPFKATIILKQTQVISKEPKDGPKVKPKESTQKHAKTQNEGKHAAQKVKSPPQTLQKPSKAMDRSEVSAKEQLDKNDAQKVAPAVPRKPKVEDAKNSENAEVQDVRRSLQIDDVLDEISPSIDIASKSVKENIHNFEKQTQQQTTVKSTYSPRRKSDVIRITLVGSQQKGNEISADKLGYAAQTMKTSKSCPKTFEEDIDIDDGPSLTALLAAEVESQVTRFSAETPTTTTAFKEFPDEMRRSGMMSPVNTHAEMSTRKAPGTPPKATSAMRKQDEKPVCRRAASTTAELENGDLDLPRNGSATINRLGFMKSGGNITSISQELDAILATSSIPKSSGLFTHPNATQNVMTPTSRQPLQQFQNAPLSVSTPTSRYPPGTMAYSTMQTTARQASQLQQQPPIPQHSIQSCMPPHSLQGGIPMHVTSAAQVANSSMHSYPAQQSMPPHVPPHALQTSMSSHGGSSAVPPHIMSQSGPTIPAHLNQTCPNVPQHSMHPGMPPHSVPAGTRVVTSQPGMPQSQLPPNAYNLPPGALVEQQRRLDSEISINPMRGREFQDQPYYVVSPSQPNKVGPMSAQARLLDNRQYRAAPPANKVPMRSQPPRDDDLCLRLCEQVDKSLQLIRLQVDSLGLAAANEPESLTELVPPPPEFNFAPGQQHGYPQSQHGGQAQNVPLHIAPPPEFSDESLARQRRAQMPQGMVPAVPQHRMAPPPSTMDAPVSRRAVPPDTIRYPYPEHAYRGHMPQNPQDPRQLQLLYHQQQQMQHAQQVQQMQHHHPQQMQHHHQQMQQMQHHQQQQQHAATLQHHPPSHQMQHHQPQHSMPNNVSSSPIKTMTMTRSGYPSHSQQHQQQLRYEGNCNTLPHPGARMVMLPPQPQQQQQQMAHQRMEHPYPTGGRSVRDDSLGNIPPPPQPQKEFRQKPLLQWNMRDVSDWLESLFLPEYKVCFAEAGITGSRLANMDNNDLMGLGVKQAGHRMNMERSIKWYLK